MTLVLSWCSFERLISPKMQPHPFSHLRNVDGGGNQLKLDNLTWRTHFPLNCRESWKFRSVWTEHSLHCSIARWSLRRIRRMIQTWASQHAASSSPPSSSRRRMNASQARESCRYEENAGFRNPHRRGMGSFSNLITSIANGGGTSWCSSEHDTRSGVWILPILYLEL